MLPLCQFGAHILLLFDDSLSLSVDHRIDEINLHDCLLLSLCVHRRVANITNSLPPFAFLLCFCFLSLRTTMMVVIIISFNYINLVCSQTLNLNELDLHYGLLAIVPNNILNANELNR